MTTIKAAGVAHTLNVNPDFPDIRDRFYEPPLVQLSPGLEAPIGLIVMDQHQEGACTGFALAATINLLMQQQSQALAALDGASPRMLYEMAKLHDEWDGTTYSGSSIRGAIKGFFHNGVCRETSAPFVPNQQGWSLTVPQAKEARNVILGSYYRLRPNLVDYHAALTQAGAIAVSADIHSGWTNPGQGVIERTTRMQGSHAFAIVGYDKDGFIIQNSWGTKWGRFGKRPGLAHWSYDDWASNIIDAWVLRLAVPTPSAFDLTHTVAKRAGTVQPSASSYTPRRQDVIGHIVHVNNGELVETGNYGTPMSSLQETSDLLRQDAQVQDRKYDHLLFYAHGGVTDAVAAARKAAVMRDGFKRNGIYPMHFIWETGLIQELGDILQGAIFRRGGPVGGFQEEMDFLLEKLTAVPGRGLWREMKKDAERTFATGTSSAQAVKLLLDSYKGLANPPKVHLVGHSAGSNFVCEFVDQWSALMSGNLAIENAFVLAPACTVDQFNGQLLPAVAKGVVQHITTYDLVDKREQDDSVGPYSKSLLYLVSNAFEEKPTDPLLGMEIFASELPKTAAHTILYAGRDNARTNATSHGGYGTDLTTLNDILRTVCGEDYKPSLAFRQEELAAA